MEDIDVRILNLSNKLSTNPYQDPQNTQYVTYLPSSEREISPVPTSGQDSSVSSPIQSLTFSNTTQSTSPSTSVSSRSPNYDCAKTVTTKRPNAIFSLSNKGTSSKSSKLSPRPVEQPEKHLSVPSNPPSKKKAPSIFMNAKTARASSSPRSMNPSSPISTNSRLASSPKRKLKDVKSVPTNPTRVSSPRSHKSSKDTRYEVG